MIENYFSVLTVIAETIISGGGIIAIASVLIEHSKLNKHKPITWAFNKLGHLLTNEIMKEVREINVTMQDNIKQDIYKVEANLNKRVDEVVMQVEQNKRDEKKLHDFEKANRLHDDILLQADKMRLAGKFPSEERARVLYQKVLDYRTIVEKYENDDEPYINGVCEVACEYIETWFKRNYESGEI